jgi:hypothetical protein
VSGTRRDQRRTNARAFEELIGLAQFGREANPDAEITTVGELLDMGKEAIRRDVEGDTDR